MRRLDHAVTLPAIALITKRLKVGQIVASSLGEGHAMMHLQPDTDSASTATHTCEMIALQDEEPLPQRHRHSFSGDLG